LVWRLQRVFRLASDTGRSLLCKGQEVDRHGVAVGVDGVGAQEVRSSGAVDGRFPRPERWIGHWIDTGIGEQDHTDLVCLSFLKLSDVSVPFKLLSDNSRLPFIGLNRGVVEFSRSSFPTPTYGYDTQLSSCVVE